MTGKKLSNSVFWLGVAFVMKYLDLNLFGLNILPDWLGFGILLVQMEELTDAHPDIKLLEPLAKLLLLWVIICGLVPYIHGEWNPYGINLIAAVVWMYLQFQLLTDLAEMARDCEYPDWSRILQLRTVLTLVATAGMLPLDWNGRHVYVYVMNAVFVVAVFWLCRVLFRFADYLDPDDPLTNSFSESLKEK